TPVPPAPTRTPSPSNPTPPPVLPVVVPVATPTGPGAIALSCSNINGNPQVNFSWTMVANAHLNVIQKRLSNGSFTDMPQPIFSESGPPFSQNSFIDRAVSLGQSYVYRYKP